MSDGVLIPLPPAMLTSRFLQGFTNQYPRDLLFQWNRNNLPLEPKQFLVLLRGDSSRLVSALNAKSTKESIADLMMLLHFWNKYTIAQFNGIIGDAIDSISIRMMRENDVFWSTRKDDMTSSLRRRMFDANLVKPTPGEEEELEGYKQRVEDARRFSEEENKEYLSLPWVKRTYVDPSEFLMTPLPIAEYFADITRYEYRFIFESAMVLSPAIPLRLFAATACSYRYYHLVLDERILKFTEKLNEVAIISAYIRYLLYLAYKEEAIYKTHSREEHRHMMRREVSCQLRMIWCHSLFPARDTRVHNGQDSDRMTIKKFTLGRYIYPPAETHRHAANFSNDIIVALKLPFPTDVYITGSINTAASVRVPRPLKPEEAKSLSVYRCCGYP